MFHYLLFLCIQKIQTERSISSIYHLLKGKKSIQTIQDGYLFKLSFLFGVYTKLDREAFDKEIQTLEFQQYIDINKENQATLTELGENYFQRLESTYSSFYFNGLEYGKQPDKLLQFLYLLVQTVTYLQANQKQFIPIIDEMEIQQSVKKFLKQTPFTLDEILKTIYLDVQSILESFPQHISEIVVETFTTIRQTGLTRFQLADKYQQSTHDISLIVTSFGHELTRRYSKNHTFQALKFFPSEESKDKSLTYSAKQTLNMLEKGYQLHDVAKIRRLKLATIEDHVIEIVYSSNRLEWNTFMSKETLELIWGVISKLQTVKLKSLKNGLPDEITYFQIKLALALYHKGEIVR